MPHVDSGVVRRLPFNPIAGSVILPLLWIIGVLVGCSSSPRFAGRGGSTGEDRRQEPAPAAEKARPAATATGRVLLTLEGIASYYADDFHGKQAANGEMFDMNDFTAAHRTFPFGTKVRVTNLSNSRSVVVRINDRGPFVDGRLIDLSLAAAKSIDLIRSGTTRVKLEVVQWGDGTLYHRK